MAGLDWVHNGLGKYVIARGLPHKMVLLHSKYRTRKKEEKEYFNSVLEKLKSEHKQIVADKQEIDLQLGAGIRTGRRKEDFEKKEERAEE